MLTFGPAPVSECHRQSSMIRNRRRRTAEERSVLNVAARCADTSPVNRSNPVESAPGRPGMSRPSCLYGRSKAVCIQGGSDGGSSAVTFRRTICPRRAPDIRERRFAPLHVAGLEWRRPWRAAAPTQVFPSECVKVGVTSHLSCGRERGCWSDAPRTAGRRECPERTAR